MNMKNLLQAAALVLATFAAQAHDFKAGAITIGHPYARATAAGQSTGGGFMKFVNAGGNDKLLSVSAEVSKTVELKPGGYHVMFVGLKAPLKAGDKFPLKLKFEKAGDVTVEVNVEVPGADHSMKH